MVSKNLEQRCAMLHARLLDYQVAVRVNCKKEQADYSILSSLASFYLGYRSDRTSNSRPWKALKRRLRVDIRLTCILGKQLQQCKRIDVSHSEAVFPVNESVLDIEGAKMNYVQEC